MSESSSLLRLFESSFFDTWLAVSYLFKYTDVGVQDYLCKRLLKTPEAEIQYFLPQLWLFILFYFILSNQFN